MNFKKDTERLAGGFRSIEADLRMIKERIDKRKHTDKTLSVLLTEFSSKDGFSEEEIQFFKDVNSVSGSMAHGNYFEAIQKLDKTVVPKYFPNFIGKKDGVKKIDMSDAKTGEDILGKLTNGIRENVTSTKESDLYESYLVALTGGYIHLMDNLIKQANVILSEKLLKL